MHSENSRTGNRLQYMPISFFAMVMGMAGLFFSAGRNKRVQHTNDGFNRQDILWIPGYGVVDRYFTSGCAYRGKNDQGREKRCYLRS